MALILRGCQKCGGDLYEQVLIGKERDRACLQCGWRGTPRRATATTKSLARAVGDGWSALGGDAEALRRCG